MPHILAAAVRKKEDLLWKAHMRNTRAAGTSARASTPAQQHGIRR